jgi:signal transduction histidine kinase
VRRQISRAILGVAVLLVVGLGLPLAVVVQRFYEDRAAADLQRRAAQTIVEITLPLDAAELASVTDEPDSPGPFTVYTADGVRLVGDGPADGGALTRRALSGQPASATEDGEIVLVTPLTDRDSESIIGAVRVSQSQASVDSQVRRVWLAMALAIAVALLAAAALARSQARRLAAPIDALARQADDLGRGAIGERPPDSGIEEVDRVSASLASNGRRLADLLARERAFSADVAHQLRTPLTGLRLQLERAVRDDDHTVAPDALAEVGRLEATVEHLLALARDGHAIRSTLVVDDVVHDLEARWRTRHADAGRELRVVGDDLVPPVAGADVSIAQVLDVLVDNALRHGDGVVTVRARRAPGGAVIEVTDEGDGIPPDDIETLFTRRGNGAGIGLSIARSITEAEGGRLLLASARPPSFHIVLRSAP